MRANKHLLLWSSLSTLMLLLVAAYQEHVQAEWRVQQRAYRETLLGSEREAFVVQLRQVVVPELDVADRCVSCHLGMAPGEAGVLGHPVFAPHPRLPHEASELGCTICHGGQGRATSRPDAHGAVAHWPEPMIPRRYAYASCGACHTHLSVPNAARLERGAQLVERLDCLACHALEGRGGTLRPGGEDAPLGPDLSAVGPSLREAHPSEPDRGRSARDWYERHLAAHEAAAEGPWRESFGPIRGDDLAALQVYLESRVGAPGLIEAKALFHSLGCRGCHAVGGIGGDDGPDLTLAGRRDPGQLDFTHVPAAGEHGRDLSSWLAEHFRAPATVVPGSAMPALGLTEEQIDRLVFYLHSLRRSEVPAARWPRDRVEAEHFDVREFGSDGATLYGAFCAACHGSVGEGMRFPGTAAFPALAAPDFLRLASDEFLRGTIERGRPGRRMPAWGQLEGGLRPGEIDRLVTYLRELGGGVQPEPDPRPARWVSRTAADDGERWYAAICASCHGARGEGGEGPALANSVLLETATDTYLLETVASGRAGTSMPAFSRPSPLYPTLDREQIESIVAHLRTWENPS